MAPADAWLDGVSAEYFERKARSQAAEFLEFVRRTAQAAEVPCDMVVVTGKTAFDAILDTANARGCDLIVMTGHCRKGLLPMMMGSEVTRVLHRSSIPILTFRALVSAPSPDRALETHQLELTT